jgi:thiol:disulfide interchange protein DsbD
MVARASRPRWSGAASLAPALAALVAVMLVPALARADVFSEAVGRGPWAALSVAFLSGLATALTPCVYPMVPITVSVFGAKGVSRMRAFALATAYVLGLALMYGALGTIVGLTHGAFGSILGSPWFVIPIAALFVVLATSMFGAFEIALPMGLQQRLSQVGGKGFTGAFLMGIVAGFIAAPCTGPPLLAMLTWVGTTGNAVKGFAFLFTYALGIGVPFWAIAGFAMQLPKSGPWMETVKSVFGCVMLGAALYYLAPILPFLKAWTTGQRWFFVVELGLAGLGLAIGAVRLSFHGAPAAKLRKALGVALLVGGGFGAVSFVVHRGFGAALFWVAPKYELTWLRSEEEAVRVARAEGKVMVMDFGAAWCLPCVELEKNVFHHPDVAEQLSKFTLVKVDLTREFEDASLQALKQKYEVGALPSVRVVRPDGKISARVDGLVGVPEFLEALAKGSSGTLARR